MTSTKYINSRTFNENMPVKIERHGERKVVRFCELIEGDKILSKPDMVVGVDAHEWDGGAEKGWLFYDTKGESVFPEDVATPVYKVYEKHINGATSRVGIFDDNREATECIANLLRHGNCDAVGSCALSKIEYVDGSLVVYENYLKNDEIHIRNIIHIPA